MIISDDRHVCSQKGGEKLGFQFFGARKGYDEKPACNHKLHLYFGNPFARRVRRCVKCGRIVCLSWVGELGYAILNALFFFALCFLTFWIFKIVHPLVMFAYFFISSYFSLVLAEVLFPLQTDNRLLR